MNRMLAMASGTFKEFGINFVKDGSHHTHLYSIAF